MPGQLWEPCPVCGEEPVCLDCGYGQWCGHCRCAQDPADVPIEELARQYCREDPHLGRLIDKDGQPGILFLDEHEFIPFTDLGYNAELGFFRRSVFPDQPTEGEVRS